MIVISFVSVMLLALYLGTVYYYNNKIKKMAKNRIRDFSEINQAVTNQEVQSTQSLNDKLEQVWENLLFII